MKAQSCLFITLGIILKHITFYVYKDSCLDYICCQQSKYAYIWCVNPPIADISHNYLSSTLAPALSQIKSAMTITYNSALCVLGWLTFQICLRLSRSQRIISTLKDVGSHAVNQAGFVCVCILYVHVSIFIIQVWILSHQTIWINAIISSKSTCLEGQ